MSGQQLTLDLELVALPQSEVTHAKILNSDIQIGDQSLQIANDTQARSRRVLALAIRECFADPLFQPGSHIGETGATLS